MHTKTFLQKHPFKKDILSISRLITDTESLKFRKKALFNHIQSQVTIGSETYAGTIASQKGEP